MDRGHLILLSEMVSSSLGILRAILYHDSDGGLWSLSWSRCKVDQRHLATIFTELIVNNWITNAHYMVAYKGNKCWNCFFLLEAAKFLKDPPECCHEIKRERKSIYVESQNH